MGVQDVAAELSNDSPALVQARLLFDWVHHPDRCAQWKREFAEAKAYGEESADCTFIIFTPTHLASRSLEARLSKAARDAGLNVSAQAIEYAACWMVCEWWEPEEEIEANV